MGDWFCIIADICVQSQNFLHIVTAKVFKIVRTNIEIDDELMATAMRLGGFKTKRETVETGLALLVRLQKQERIRRARGKLHWTGDLDEMRRDK